MSEKELLEYVNVWELVVWIYCEACLNDRPKNQVCLFGSKYLDIFLMLPQDIDIHVDLYIVITDDDYHILGVASEYESVL